MKTVSKMMICKTCGKEIIPPDAKGAEALARRFHEVYERLAPSFGYETRKETREFNPSTPNGKLMIAVCQELLSEPWRKWGSTTASEQVIATMHFALTRITEWARINEKHANLGNVKSLTIPLDIAERALEFAPSSKPESELTTKP